MKQDPLTRLQVVNEAIAIVHKYAKIDSTNKRPTPQYIWDILLELHKLSDKEE